MADNVLVVGGAGYIGSMTARELVQEGHAVSVLDNFSFGHRAAALRAGVAPERIFEGSLEDRDRVREVLQAGRFDTLLHFAALTSVPESVAQPHRYLKANAVNALRLFNLATEFGVQQVVFSSTAATYGSPRAQCLDRQGRITEDHPTEPENPYGLTKLMIEEVLREMCEAGRLRAAVALRYFNACGARDDLGLGEDHDPEGHVLPRLMAAALRLEPAFKECFPEARFGRGFTIFGTDYPTDDGTAVRDYIHIEDLARAHVKAVEHLSRGAEKLQVFNVGTGEGYSVRQVLSAVEKELDRGIPHSLGERRAGDPPYLVASSEKLQGTFDWKARYGLQEIVASVHRWMRQHPRGYGDR